MTSHFCLITVIIVTLCISRTLGCSQRNTSCKDIKTLSGFKFSYDCPTATETVAAYGNVQTKSYYFLSDVVTMDGSSIVTRQCRDLKIQCILYDGTYAAEACVNFKTTEMGKAPEPWTPGVLIGVPVCLILILCLSVIPCWCYTSWKKKQHGRPTFSGFLRYLLSFCSHKKGISTADRRESDETSLVHGRLPTSMDPRGCGENYMDENKQDNTLRTVHVDSTDTKADGKIPQNIRLNYNLGNKGIQPNKMNLRDDPGGVNHNTENNIVREAVQSFDVTGEAIALVNKHSFDPNQVNMCPTAPDTDVESTPNMRKTEP
ncbi:uncharacterized protein [Channa argus]|uniref:uncharacterized protein isoform X2 n=1 Tax=Channa argus TaxID=215402 RepID=UPI003521A403